MPVSAVVVEPVETARVAALGMGHSHLAGLADRGLAMRTVEAAIEIRARPEAVFDLIHDYARRLEWDPFLKEACLLEGAEAAGRGVKARCTARNGFGGLAMETIYLSFDRPAVAAVKMTKGPAVLEDGQHRNDTEDLSYFTTAYFHRPEELVQELESAGFQDARVFGVEGPGWILPSSANHPSLAQAPTCWGWV